MPTTEPTSPAFALLLHEPGPISGINNNIGDIDIYDTMRYELDIRIDSLPSASSQWGHILWCGNANNIRMPLIAVHHTFGSVNSTVPGFHIKYSTTNSWNDPNGVTSMGADLSMIIGQTYHVVIDITQNWMSVLIDGVSVYNKSKTPHTLYQNQTCGAPSPWGASNYATLSNIIISTGTMFYIIIRIICISDMILIDNK